VHLPKVARGPNHLDAPVEAHTRLATVIPCSLFQPVFPRSEMPENVDFSKGRSYDVVAFDLFLTGS